MSVILLVGTALPYSRLSVYVDNDLENTPTINVSRLQTHTHTHAIYSNGHSV